MTMVNMQNDEGPLKVNVYSRFSEKDLLPHDWNIVVLGKEHPVSIKNSDDMMPDFLFFLAIVGGVVFVGAIICCVRYFWKKKSSTA